MHRRPAMQPPFCTATQAAYACALPAALTAQHSRRTYLLLVTLQVKMTHRVLAAHCRALAAHRLWQHTVHTACSHSKQYVQHDSLPLKKASAGGLTREGTSLCRYMACYCPPPAQQSVPWSSHVESSHPDAPGLRCNATSSFPRPAHPLCITHRDATTAAQHCCAPHPHPAAY